MSYHKELQIISRKDNLQNISDAFRKLFDQVSTRMHSQNFRKNIAKSSLSIKTNESFFRSRKNSIVLSNRRKNSYFPQSRSVSPTKSLNAECQDSGRSQKLTINKNVKKQSFKSVRRRSLTMATEVKGNDLYSQIASYNQLLITKMFLFEDPNSHKTSKNFKQRKIIKKANLNDTQSDQPSAQKSNFQSRIKICQKSRRLHAVQKKQQIFSRLKEHQQRVSQFQPWQTDKAQEFFYLVQ